MFLGNGCLSERKNKEEKGEREDREEDRNEEKGKKLTNMEFI